MAIAAARAKKWIFSEVPAVNTLQEGWDLVHAVEESGVGYLLAENYVFMRNNMMVLNMVEQGLFGTLTSAECGYIHEARTLQFTKDGGLTWRGELNSSPTLIGNTYPTHSLGPACSWLGIPRGDQIDPLHVIHDTIGELWGVCAQDLCPGFAGGKVKPGTEITASPSSKQRTVPSSICASTSPPRGLIT